MQSISKYLIILGALILVIGLLFTIFPKISLFRTPGDIEIKKENFSIYFPVVTCIVISIVLSLILWLINFFSKK